MTFSFCLLIVILVYCLFAEFIWSFLPRSKLEKAKKEQENRLEYVKEQLEIYTHDAKRQIKEITSKVEGQVMK